MENNLLINLQTRHQRNRRKRLIRFLLLIFIVITGIYFFFNQGKNGPANPNTTTNNSLKDAVENTLAGTKGTYAVVIKNFKTGESYNLNENRTYAAGSLYKLWIMATAFNKIQDGTLAEDEVLSEDVEALNNEFNIDPELAEQTEGTITLSVSDALNQMITISHNYAALLLTEKIKLSAVAAFLKDKGFNQSKVGTDGEDPETTPSEVARFFEKLYKAELANEEYTIKMLNLLKNQQLNDKLPKYLPQGTVVAHKTGEIGWLTHDAGIVYSPKGDYIIVVLSESDSPPGAEDRIAEVSKAVYDYFQK